MRKSGLIEIVPLSRTSEDQYCRFAQSARFNEFWWYFNGLGIYPGFSKPFLDSDGNWWYHVKPCFAWPVDFFHPIKQTWKKLPRKMLLGCQFPVSDIRDRNSEVHLNVIDNLAGFNLSSISSSKRRAIRKGGRRLEVSIADPSDPVTAMSACDVWNSHVRRTGWNKPMTPKKFLASWKELHRWPGTTVIVARNATSTGSLCAWLIARTIGQTVFIDTIASHSARLSDRPNDTIIFSCLLSAAQAGIKRAHYSLVSKLPNLEKFKRTLGFSPTAFPTRLLLRSVARWGLTAFARKNYARMIGQNPPSCELPPVVKQ